MAKGDIEISIDAKASGAIKGFKETESAAQRAAKVINKGAKIAAAGFAAAGVGALALAKGAAEDQQAATALATQLKNTTGATNKQVAAVEDWISKQGQLTGITDDELRPALANLATATGSVAKAQQLASLAQDVAIGTGKDYRSVVEAFQKAANGSVGGLSRLGIATKDAEGKTKSFAEIQADMAAKFKGQSAQAAKTLGGRMKVLQTQLAEAGETIGYALIPVLTTLADKGAAALAWAEKHQGTVKVLAAAVGGLGAAFILAAGAMKVYAASQTIVAAATKAWAGVQWILNAAMSANPIGLVVLAVAALVAGVVIAYKKSETFRKIVTGAFDAVKGAASAAFGWVKQNWPRILAILAGPIGAATLLVIKNWDKITAAAGKLVGAVKSKVDQIGGFFTKLPGRILRSVGDLGTLLVDKGWDIIRGLVGGLRDGANALVDKAIQFVVDKIPGPVKKLLGIKSPSRVMMPIGYNVGAGLAVGIESSSDRVGKAVTKMTKKLKKALKGALADKRDLVSSLSDDVASLWDSVASSFKPDVFSGTVADLAKSLGKALATNKAVQAALPGLQKILGGSSEFFQQLLGSGNSQLILALAANPGAAQSYQAQFNEANAYASQIGKAVADASETAAVQKQTLAEMKQIKAVLNKQPGATSAPIVKAIAGSIPKGKKNSKKKLGAGR